MDDFKKYDEFISYYVDSLNSTRYKFQEHIDYLKEKLPPFEWRLNNNIYFKTNEKNKLFVYVSITLSSKDNDLLFSELSKNYYDGDFSKFIKQVLKDDIAYETVVYMYIPIPKNNIFKKLKNNLRNVFNNNLKIDNGIDPFTGIKELDEYDS